MSAAVAQKPSPASQATPKKKKTKAVAPAHPPFKFMIIEAIEHLNDPKNGASRKAIRTTIEDLYAPRNIATFLNKNLARMVADGQLKHPKKFPGKYIIDTEKAEKKTKSPKKKAAKKPKSETAIKKGAQAKKKKSVEKKLKVKSAKKSPVKRGRPKKSKSPPTPKTAGATEKKRGRGRPKNK